MREWLMIFFAKMEAHPKLHGLTTRQLMMLLLLGKREHLTTGMQPRVIAAELGVQRPIVARATNTLVSRGLVQRAKDPWDNRGYFIMLTHVGEEVSQQLVKMGMNQ